MAIAWKPTPQAARAVAAAMPLLMRAKDIVVMTVEEESAPWQMDGLVRNLAWHGLAVTAERLTAKRRDPAKTLLDSASKTASLLIADTGIAVSGSGSSADSHSRCWRRRHWRC